MKKKLLALLIAASAAFVSVSAFSACGNGGTEVSDAHKWGSEYSFTAAYAQAQELGYAGTLDEFVEMISGKDGANGINGTNGKDGAEGKSAYQIWLDNGNTGSQTDFLNWLKGADGADGTNGTNGKDGKDGVDGVGIKSATVNAEGHLILTLTDGSVTDCGKVLDVHTHSFGEWIVLTEPGCGTTGLQLRICETCAYTEAEIIPATEQHVWSARQPDEETDSHSRVCTVCEKKETEPHIMTDGFCADCGLVDNLNLAMPVRGDIITTHEEFYQNTTTGAWQFHSGVDISADEGVEVVAAISGTIESIVFDDGRYGTYVTISHAPELTTEYKLINIKEGLAVGDKVDKGDVIGSVSEASGLEYLAGPHLHFEVKIGDKSVDPEPLFDNTDN